MTYVYRDQIVMPGTLTLDSFDELIDKFRELGSAEPVPGKPRCVAIEYEGADLWELRETLSEVEGEVSANFGLALDIDRDKVQEV